ncbi:MAG: alpha/beta hydrolase [Bacillota bacterium]
MVAKLVLVSSGAFVACYAEGLTDARKARLTAEESAEVDAILAQMTGEPASGPGADARLARLGQLMSRADGYKVLPESTATRVECDMRVFQGVWPEAAALRESGQLLALGRHITCPVVAIHGDFDPSPANGVRVPLSSVLADFRFILLERCGHSPWEERWAAGEFFRVLDRILE